MRGLVLVALAALLAASAAFARPAGKVPINRLNVLREVIRDWQRSEETAMTDWVAQRMQKLPADIDEMNRRRDVVEKELRKSAAAGLNPAYVKDLRRELGDAIADDKRFEADKDKPVVKEKGDPLGLRSDYVPGLDLALMSKRWMIRLIDRTRKNVAAPAPTLESLAATAKKALEQESAAMQALVHDTPSEANEGKARDPLNNAAATLEALQSLLETADDHGLLSDDDVAALREHIAQAQDADRQAYSDVGGDDDATWLRARQHLAAAGDEKEAFLETLGHAIAHPPAAPKAGAEKPGPACVAGSATAAAQPIANPTQAEPTALYFVLTPIPNHDYYNHRHGFSGGGCDAVGGKLQANIDVLGSDGSLVAWDYQFGTFPSGKQSSDGQDCPYTPPQTTLPKKVCIVQIPHLGVPLPKEGYVPPQDFTEDRSDFKELAVIVPVEFRVPPEGTAGSITVRIAWQPKK